MRDEAKTWWLVSGPDVASSYFFKSNFSIEKCDILVKHRLAKTQLNTQGHDDLTQVRFLK